MRSDHFLVLDAGTTAVKAFVFDRRLRVVARASATLAKQKPRRGWVEQRATDIIIAAVRVLREAVRASGLPTRQISSLGITNQRETVVVWDRITGRPLAPAIVWEDARTAARCQSLRRRFNGVVRPVTGLPIDSYFSATKIQWLLAHNPRVARAATTGRLAVGTVDSWLLWKLVAGKPHLTDHTNASRTLLYNIRTLQWDPALLTLFGVPHSALPGVRSSCGEFGMLRRTILKASIPVRVVCGDQQAGMAAAGRSGATKITSGTGTFIMQVLGPVFQSHPPFFTTLVPHRGRPWYALEAKVAPSGPQVTRLLGRPRALRAYLRVLARKTNQCLRRLPRRPKVVVLDGGATRDGIFADELARASGMRVTPQRITDGTALGVAKLLRDHYAD